MQRNYRADGWLGMIAGTKLFYDFSGKYSFESRIEGLLKELSEKGKPACRPKEGAVLEVCRFKDSFIDLATAGKCCICVRAFEVLARFFVKPALMPQESM